MIHVKSSLWVRPSYCLFAHETIRNISINTTRFVKKNRQIVGSRAVFWYFYNKTEVESLRAPHRIRSGGARQSRAMCLTGSPLARGRRLGPRFLFAQRKRPLGLSQVISKVIHWVTRFTLTTLDLPKKKTDIILRFNQCPFDLVVEHAKVQICCVLHYKRSDSGLRWYQF